MHNSSTSWPFIKGSSQLQCVLMTIPSRIKMAMFLQGELLKGVLEQAYDVTYDVTDKWITKNLTERRYSSP